MKCINQILTKMYLAIIMLVITVSLLGGAGIIVEAKLFGPKTANGNLPQYNVQSCAFPSKIGNWIETCALNRFDVVDGELRKVYVELSIGTNTDIRLKNLGDSTDSFTVTANTDVTLKDKTNNKNVITVNSKGTTTFSLKPLEELNTPGIIKKSGVLGAVVFDYAVASDADFINSFKVGNNGVQNKFDLGVVSTADIKGSGNQDATIVTQTAIESVKFIYEYYQSDLSIVKTHSPSSMQSGTKGSITLAVTNNNDEATKEKITVTDPLPAYFKFLNQSNPDWSCTPGSIITCTSTKSIPALGTSTITMNFDIVGETPLNYPNVAKVSYPIREYNEKNNTANDLIPFINPPMAYDCDLGTHMIGHKVEIKDLGKPCLVGTTANKDDKITKFIIKSLPSTDSATLLYMNNPVIVGQVFLTGEENKITVLPQDGYVGDLSFTYTVEDSNKLQDLTPATVKLKYVKEKPLTRTGGYENYFLPIIFTLSLIGLVYRYTYKR
jgi:Domain of unknown function DUF11